MVCPVRIYSNKTSPATIAGRWLAALLVAIGFAAITPAQAAPPDTLVIGVGMDPHKMNPMLEDHGWTDASSVLFDRLFTVGPDGEIINDLATDFWFSDDGMYAHVKLNPHAHWHDGTLINSADVVWSISFMREERLCGNLHKQVPYDMDCVAESRMGVRFGLPHPITNLKEMLTQVPILPSLYCKLRDINYQPFLEHPNGLGPYKFVRYDEPDTMVLEAMPRHHNGNASIKNIRLVHIADEHERAKALAAGKVQMGRIAASDRAMLESIDSLKLVQLATGVWRGMPLNVKNPLLADKRVRKAIYWAIDRDALVNKALGGLGKPAFFPAVAGTWAFESAPQIPGAADVAKANQLLDEAGFTRQGNTTRTKDGKSLTLRCVVWKDDAFRNEAARLIRDQLAAVGIELKLLEVGHDEYIKMSNDMGDRCETFIGGWGGLSDPFGNIYRKFFSTGMQNQMGYVNTEVDRLLDEARKSTNRETVKRLLGQAFELILDDCAIVPLVYPDYLFAIPKNLTGFPTGPVESWYELTQFANMWNFEE